MSSRRGKIYNDDRFVDDNYLYDQEFGRNSLERSSMNRSLTTYYNEEKENRTETNFQSETINRPPKGKTFIQKESPNRTIESHKTQKPTSSSRPGIDLGRQLKKDLVVAAELKLGTKLNTGKSLFQFWMAHIKLKAPKPVQEQSLMATNAEHNKSSQSMQVMQKSSKAPLKSIPEESPSVAAPPKKAKKGESKNEKLKAIYEQWETAYAADVKVTLNNDDKYEADMKEQIESMKKIEGEKAAEQLKDNAIRDEIKEYFKRYMQREARDQLTDLQLKASTVDHLRRHRAEKERRAKSRSQSAKRSPTKSQTRKRQGTKSPIKLEGSLDDIEESKLSASGLKDSISKVFGKKTPKSTKNKNKKEVEIIDHKMTDEEIEKFNLEVERTKLMGSLDVLFRIYSNLVNKSRKSTYGFTNNPEQLFNVFKDKRPEKMMNELTKIFADYQNSMKGPEDKETKAEDFRKEVMIFVENSIKEYFKSDQTFMRRVIVLYEKAVAPQLRSNDKVFEFYKSFTDQEKLTRGIMRNDAEKVIKDWVKAEVDRIEKQKRGLEALEKLKEMYHKKQSEKVMKEFKNPEVTAKPLEELCKPKDKWKRGKKLMDLARLFPHDLVLQRMIKDEFKENRVFKYPEEYEIYDDEEEARRKMPKTKKMTIEERRQFYEDVEEKQKLAIEKFIAKENIRQDQIQFAKDQKRNQMKQFNEAMTQEVDTYIENMKNRLNEKREQSQRETLAGIYHRMHDKFPDIMDEKFPHVTYGMKKDSESYKKSFPQTFKYEFYRRFNIRKKKSRGLSSRPAYFVPSGINKDSYNSKIKLGEEIMKKYEKPAPGVKTRVWKRGKQST